MREPGEGHHKMEISNTQCTQLGESRRRSRAIQLWTTSAKKTKGWTQKFGLQTDKPNAHG